MNKDLLCACEALLSSGASFALFRQPNEEITLIMQSDGGETPCESLEECADLSGFMLAPFVPGKDLPTVIIRDDTVSRGAAEISRASERLLADRAGGKKSVATELEAIKEEDPVRQKERYLKAFSRFMEGLDSGRFDKLVLSRRTVKELPCDFSPARAFLKACELYPGTAVSLVSSAFCGLRLGATPEILIKGRGERFETMSLAGTMYRADHGSFETLPTLDAWSEKNRREQRIVTDYIELVLKGCATGVEKSGPYTAAAGRVVHLRSDFAFTLADPAGLVEVIRRLHPTPAVCGLPKDEAYEYIREHEGYARGYYAGLIGPFRVQGETALYVNLRCMEIMRDRAVLYAGGGIVAGSDPEDEFEETGRKCEAMLSLL